MWIVDMAQPLADFLPLSIIVYGGDGRERLNDWLNDGQTDSQPAKQ